MRCVSFFSKLIPLCLLLGACGPADLAESGGNPWTFGDHDGGGIDTCPVITGKLRRVDDEADLTVCGEPDAIINYDRQLLEYEGCEIIRSHVILAFFHGEDVPELRSLRKSEQQLVIRASDTLVSVKGLKQLEVVGGGFVLEYSPNLRSLEGLENLREVNMGMVLWDLPNITTLEPLGNLEVVEGLRLSNLPQLTSLEGLASLCRIDGDLRIGRTNITREEFDKFLARVEVTGTVTFHGETLSQ